MKSYSYSNKAIFLSLLFICVISIYDCFKSNEYLAKKKKHRKQNLNTLSVANPPQLTGNETAPTGNMTNRIALNTAFKVLTNNPVPMDQFNFYTTMQNWDYNMLPYEIKDIFQYMLFRQNGRVEQNSLRIFYQVFVTSFKNCDLNYDNTLNYSEFLGCLLVHGPEFKYILPPIYNYTAFNPILIRKSLFSINSIN